MSRREPRGCIEWTTSDSRMPTMPQTRRLRKLWRNPFFHYELERGSRKIWIASLVSGNTLYVVLFLLARALPDLLRDGRPGSALQADFNYSPWFAVGAVLLSLSAHWLVPPLLVRVLRQDYELWPLVLMVRDRHSAEEAYQGQIAAGLAPLVLGVLPLLAGVPFLAAYGPQHVPKLLAALLLAGCWGALSTGVSMWSSTIYRPVSLAAACAYTLTSLALPAAIGLITFVVARGCSAGHPNREFVFAASALLTWSILVIGTAATFWDATVGRLFPDQRGPLCDDVPVTRLEP